MDRMGAALLVGAAILAALAAALGSRRRS